MICWLPYVGKVLSVELSGLMKESFESLSINLEVCNILHIREQLVFIFAFEVAFETSCSMNIFQ